MKKLIKGRVISDRMEKTIRVRAERRFIHPIYKKTVRESKNFLAHDEKREAKTGDLVEIVETRPLSKLKRWRLIRVLEKAT